MLRRMKRRRRWGKKENLLTKLCEIVGNDDVLTSDRRNYPGTSQQAGPR